MCHIRLALVAFCAVDALLGLPVTFTSGALIWARQQDYRLFDVTTGGNLADPAFVAYGSSTDQSGQIAFALDLTAMYTTGGNGKVYRHVPGNSLGTRVATLPTSSPARGIVVTPDNKIYVSAHNGNVYDITSGTPAVFASGLSRPRNMVWTPTGILVAEQTTNEVTNLGSGGSMTSRTPFASGIPGPLDIVMFQGRIYVSATDGVYDITAGGAMTTANRLAWGQSFIGLAATGTALYATSMDSSPRIFDITTGGNFATASPWGYNLPEAGDTMFDAVPFLSEPEPPSQPAVSTPEGATLNLVVGGLLLLLGRRRNIFRLLS